MVLSMHLWLSNNMKVILRKSAKDDCMNSELCWLYSFFVLVLSIWFSIKTNNLKFYSQISEKTWSTLHLGRRGPIKSFLFISKSVCLSVCLSVCQDLLVDVLNSLDEDIWPYILKCDKARFWKLYLLFRWLGKQDKYGSKTEYLRF